MRSYVGSSPDFQGFTETSDVFDLNAENFTHSIPSYAHHP